MAAGDGAQLPATIAASRSVEKSLEEAAASGALNLSNRKLKEFPRTARNYDLSDIVHADLSKNRLCELPEELCQFISLETLVLYHNCIRSLTPILCHLQALTYLNLSRNLISNLPPSVCQLPLLRVLIVSNNKLSALPASIHTLTHLRQLDVSCNDLQCLPVELGQLECLRDLNLRRNRLTTLPEELSELPLVRLDVSCNHISHVPVCYRHLRQLQTIVLDNNPLQQPPAQVCSKGKYHIFKFLNIEACKRNQEELERALRPTGFNSCLSDQELFSGLDSGFNSVDSGSKRWSGNESADDFSERSLRMAELTRDQRNLEEEVEAEEDSPLTETPNRVNGEAEQVVSIDCSVTEEEEEECRTNHPTPLLTAPPQEKTKKSSPPPQTQDTSISRSSISVEVGGCGGRPLPPSSPTLEERRRPGTLLIWQERERAQQQKRDHRARDNGLLKTTTAKTGSHVATLSQTGSSSSGGSPDNRHSQNSLRQRCASADQMCTSNQVSSSHTPPVQCSVSRSDGPSSPKASSPPGLTQKPNSFLFRTSSRCSVKSQVSISGSTQSPVEAGRTELRSALRGEERLDVIQLRKTLEPRLKTTLPEDLGEALSNGTVLCQLANHVRPRAVSIIHIPSPAVPKLSTAKCRLNVENFIAACRKLGVPETEVCVYSDVFLCKLPAVLRCVAALVKYEAEGETKGETHTPQTVTPHPPHLSLLSEGFLVFYCLAMTLIYTLYYHLVA
ncbi:leucine-rich repeat and calponin homology domain-containing protein 4 isoform X1 [Coregonus clupeaformis]|uniref:leucine-rich repeat and calponin homology domain-containing protein 4 isoform X1 n=1 Tax=Coregonus clupeaformis TaxID=59861 RepID=UPI001E1C2E1D|nr:leucine-rich repeat and calponin homology domain-containing protein 4 isoform X1 [Coregonus clupeaformis]